MRIDKKRHTVMFLIAAVTVMLTSAYAFELLNPARKWFQGIGGRPDDLPVLFLINVGGEESVADGDNGVTACIAATQWWEDELDNSPPLNLLTTETTLLNTVGNDLLNITSFNDPARIVRGALAVSVVGFFDSGPTETVNGTSFGRYRDSDVSFSKSKKFTTSAIPGCNKAYDIQAIQAQEIGHSLGFDHSANGSAIMFGSIGQCVFKTIHLDDHNVVNTVYNPGFGGPTPCTATKALLTEHTCSSPPRGANCLIIAVGVSDDCGDPVNASVTVRLTGEPGDVLTGTASTGNDGRVRFRLRCRDAASTTYVSEVTSIEGSFPWNPADSENTPNPIPFPFCVIR